MLRYVSKHGTPSEKMDSLLQSNYGQITIRLQSNTVDYYQATVSYGKLQVCKRMHMHMQTLMHMHMHMHRHMHMHEHMQMHMHMMHGKCTESGVTDSPNSSKGLP